ncbi:hypothetical protein [Nakamurella sp.]|uniref:hypothetical protein n=1 Tax=Nakamurella sp. TaxID=1869182 RepID=UPI003B3A356A
MHAHQGRTTQGWTGAPAAGPVPAGPFGRWQGAGNRAIAALLRPAVQREEEAGTAEALPTAEDTGRVDDLVNAVLSSVDGAAVAGQLRQDAAAQGGGSSAAAESGAGTDAAQVQTLRAGASSVQRDPTTPSDPATPSGPPAPTTKPADLSDVLDAILALPTVKGLLDRLADIAAREIKKAGAPATITLATFVVPPLLVGLNQGLGVTKLVLKTPEIPLGRDAQGVPRSVRFRFEATVDPKTGGGGSLGAEFKF